MPVILCACLYDVGVGDAWCDSQHGCFFPVAINSVDGLVLPGTSENRNASPFIWVFWDHCSLGESVRH